MIIVYLISPLPLTYIGLKFTLSDSSIFSEVGSRLARHVDDLLPLVEAACWELHPSEDDWIHHGIYWRKMEDDDDKQGHRKLQQVCRETGGDDLVDYQWRWKLE